MPKSRRFGKEVGKDGANMAKVRLDYGESSSQADFLIIPLDYLARCAYIHFSTSVP